MHHSAELPIPVQIDEHACWRTAAALGRPHAKRRKRAHLQHVELLEADRRMVRSCGDDGREGKVDA